MSVALGRDRAHEEELGAGHPAGSVAIQESLRGEGGEQSVRPPVGRVRPVASATAVVDIDSGACALTARSTAPTRATTWVPERDLERSIHVHLLWTTWLL